MGIRLSEWEDRLRPALEEEAAELLEAHVSRRRNAMSVRLFIDREKGIGVEDLARLSRKIARILDADPVLAGAYALEVSSPGMNRVVRSEAHFRRFVGERVHVWTKSPREGRTHFEGRIEGCAGGVVSVAVDRVGSVPFDLEQIERAELRLDPRRPPGRPEGGDEGSTRRGS